MVEAAELDRHRLIEQYREPAFSCWPKERFFRHDNAADISHEVDRAHLYRSKNSHRGIAAHQQLRMLIAGAVNQPFLDEIGQLTSLEYLDLTWPVTADTLKPLENLAALRFLRIDSPRKITDFAPLLSLPRLKKLLIENAKYLTTLDWLSEASQLDVLGVEGSIWTTQQIESLRPLAGLQFEALFLTNVRLRDKDLMYLAECPNLRLLQCARFAPKDHFDALKAARPDIGCSWFDQYDI